MGMKTIYWKQFNEIQAAHIVVCGHLDGVGFFYRQGREGTK